MEKIASVKSNKMCERARGVVVDIDAVIMRHQAAAQIHRLFYLYKRSSLLTYIKLWWRQKWKEWYRPVSCSLSLCMYAMYVLSYTTHIVGYQMCRFQQVAATARINTNTNIHHSLYLTTSRYVDSKKHGKLTWAAQIHAVLPVEIDEGNIRLERKPLQSVCACWIYVCT